ncbi:thioesterase family protein [Azospirillum sp.]|uniref:thioesterase family protein n=1 Tax=Azospirillum sp. TaxID=34012 RepID=UPI003D70B865
MPHQKKGNTLVKASLTPGIGTTKRIVVDRDRTIGFMGEEGRVYATPELLRDIEQTCRDFLLEHLDADEDTVGARVELDHTAPTLAGMWVEIAVTVADVQGRSVVLEITARDPLDTICKARHGRFVVGVAKTVERLKAKAAKAAALA